MPPADDKPIVPKIPICGIGASAGGLEALQGFFQSIPADLGLAYVVIVHLAPDRKSELPSIIARWTTMSVTQVADHEQIPLKPNYVYVIAPDRKLEITDTAVGASAFEQPRGQRSAIDLFFRSLAATHGDGFAVVLSGTGADGALGAKAVKGGGGLVLVQDPDEAAHGDMPRNVIATGVADVILPVRELATRLVELARNKQRIVPLVQAAQENEEIAENEEKALKNVLDLVRKRTGHDFSRYKRTTILRRLARRLQLTQKLTIAEYWNFLRTNVQEASALFDDFLISVTTFFRDPDTWAAVQSSVIAPLVEVSEGDEQIRAWVPGCATGEEAYSLAILFHEEFERRGIRRNFVIFATDVDEGALAVAREGLYPRAIGADVSEARLERYFRLDDDHYRVATELRDNVVFAAHSLLRDPPFSRVHLISCRNLLIYLDRDLQEQVMAVFRYSCRENAFMVLGASETAPEELFRPIDKKHRVFTTRARGNGERPMLPEILAVPGERQSRLPRDVGSGLRSSAGEIHMAALEAAAPPTVVADENWNVLHLSPSASRFFQQSGGPLARRLTEIVRPELRDDLHALLYRAGEQPAPHLSAFIPVKFNGAAHRIAMLVQKRARTEDGRADVLITFLDAGEAPAHDPVPVEQGEANEQIRELREQLRQAERRIETMRDEHHLTNEDLRAANEELQSLNEEYRSTTEELETSKEELQSINEELQTVNNELKLKLEEVSHAHSDLENLMAATDVATLFLNPELRIKRFTPQLGQIFNIKSRDHDRPISDLTHTLDYDHLEDDARRVLATQSPLEHTTSSRTGQNLVVRLSPYRTDGGRDSDGVVITFIDVTAIKQAEARLTRQAEELRDQGRHREEFLATLGHELRNPLAAIVSSVSLLTPSDDRSRRAVAVLRRQTAHMTRLVDDILDVTRVKLGNVHLERRPIELDQIVRSAVDAFRSQADAQHLELKQNLPAQPLVVDADPERLAQVLDNLLRNAITYTQRGSITVTVSKDTTFARVAVRDTGTGIDADDAAGLFEPFQRRSAVGRTRGLGLGLTLVKALVEAHHGTVSFHSDGRGTGSEFSFTVPLSSSAAPAADLVPATAVGTHRILVVDDEKDVADMFGEVLQTLGQDVTITYNGEDALDSATRRTPGLAFIDLAMPNMSGSELARRLRERFSAKELTLVAMTGHGKARAAASLSDFDHYLLKPASRDKIAELLRTLSDGAEGTQ